MKNFLILVITVAIFCLGNASRLRMLGGSEAPEDRFQYQAYLKNILKVKYDGFYCGASIIDKRFVLTAAHCLDGEEPATTHVAVGTHELGSPDKVEYQAEAFFVHQCHLGGDDFNIKEKGLNDIALIRLKEDIEFNEKVKPIGLPPAADYQSPEGTTAILTGWGRIKEKGRIPTKMEMLTVLVEDTEKCKKLYEHANETITHIDSGMLCAKMQKNQGFCNGDSGGPLVDARGYQIGVVSTVKHCGNGVPDIYSKVSHYAKWINGIIKGRAWYTKWYKGFVNFFNNMLPIVNTCNL
ncbi:chymotrypsin-2-like [Trichogramma pretiosum]|uniref:chymotrypsin-2-like n=1 Tax=Trichogramma pretiosum TaxID=7493 RepID=UPI000C71C46B|nr:chymotrypsin-2-like [Trichogramma pretiosum]